MLNVMLAVRRDVLTRGGWALMSQRLFAEVSSFPRLSRVLALTLVLSCGISPIAQTSVGPFKTSAYFYPINQSENLEELKGDFQRMAQAWHSENDCTVRRHALDLPLSGRDPSVSAANFYWDHHQARVFTLGTHGFENGIVVVGVFYDKDVAEAEAAHLFNNANFQGGIYPYDNPHVIDIGSLYAGAGSTWAVAVGIEAYRKAILTPSAAALQSGGTAVLGWCFSTNGDYYPSLYLSTGTYGVSATAVMGVDGLTALRDPLMKVYETLGCKYFWSEHQVREGTWDEARYKAGNGMEVHMAGGASSAGYPFSYSCKNSDVEYLEAGIIDGTAFWTAQEFGTVEYFICGFQDPDQPPVYQFQVPRDSTSIDGDYATYRFSLPTTDLLWEVIEVDDNEGTSHKYTGFLITREPQLPESMCQDGASRVTPGNDRLVASTPVSSSELGYFGVEDLLESASPIWNSREEIRRQSGSSGPDSSLCGDWLVYSSDSAMAAVGLAAQVAYLPGRHLAAIGGTSPLDVQTALSEVILNNKTWNDWAQINGHSRRFNESPFVTLIGRPGVYVMGPHGPDVLDSVVVAYGVNSEGTPCDGVLMDVRAEVGADVPYTRIPARNTAEVLEAYAAAAEFSSGVSVDPARKAVILVEENVTATGVDARPRPLLEAFSQTHGFLTSGVVSSVESESVREERILDLLNTNGAAFIIAGGMASTSQTWPSRSLSPSVLASATREQNMLAIVPTCNSASTLYQYSLWSPEIDGALATRLLFNGPGRSRAALVIGFTGRVNYALQERWLQYLAVSSGMSRSEVVTWQEVAFDAMNLMASEDSDWGQFLLTQACVGAPVLHQGVDVTGVPDATGSGIAKDYLTVAPRSVSSNVVELVIWSTKPGTFNAKVFDIQGRLVSDLGAHTVQEGPVELELPWNRTRQAGGFVASGIYFVRVSGEGLSASTRLVLTR